MSVCGAPVQWYWQEKSETNLSQFKFVHHKSHMDLLGLELGPTWLESGD
jgi:hypothetical protein